jgi:DNA-binding NarL/FixJ family response regulator
MVSAKPELPAAPAHDAASDSAEGADNAVIRIILADSQAVYRVGTQKIIAFEDDIRVILQVDTLAGLRAAIQRFPTEVILLDGNLISGSVDAIPDLVRLAPQLKIIVQEDQNDEANTVELYRQGVQGIIPRSISPDLLVKCVRRIAAGETWIDNQSLSRVIEAYRLEAVALTRPPTQRLTPKELAVINCIAQGMRNKEIGHRLGTTEQVIKNYLRRVYQKLGVSDRLELALYCRKHQLHKKAVGTVATTETPLLSRPQSITATAGGSRATSPAHVFKVVW